MSRAKVHHPLPLLSPNSRNLPSLTDVTVSLNGLESQFIKMERNLIAMPGEISPNVVLRVKKLIFRRGFENCLPCARGGPIFPGQFWSLKIKVVLQRCFYECIEGRDDVISIKIEVLFLQSFFRNIFWKVCAKGKAISKYGELYVTLLKFPIYG